MLREGVENCPKCARLSEGRTLCGDEVEQLRRVLRKDLLQEFVW